MSATLQLGLHTFGDVTVGSDGLGEPDPQPVSSAAAQKAGSRRRTRGNLLAMQLEGIHHITAITGDAPANVEFYVGVLGLRLTRIPLRRIAFAEAVEQEKAILPYKGLVSGNVTVVLRGGPALRLTLRDGKTFLVTVDDAATGAALLNGAT